MIVIHNDEQIKLDAKQERTFVDGDVVAEVIRLRDKPILEIVEKTGVSWYVANVIRRLVQEDPMGTYVERPVPSIRDRLMKERRKKLFTPELCDKVRKLANEGMTQKAIADRCGVGRTTVQRIIHGADGNARTTH